MTGTLRGMYFRDRAQAGELLADKLEEKYRGEPVAVVALSPGGVLVGEPIARRFGCGLSMLLTDSLSAPGDVSLVLGTMDFSGNFSLNSQISPGIMEEYLQEFRSYLEESELRSLYNLTLRGGRGMADPQQLEGKNVILATDGIKTGLSFDAAMRFLKTVPIRDTIAAIPVAEADALDRVRHKVDDTHFLYIPESFFSVSHYFEEPPPEDDEALIERIDNVSADSF